MPVDKTIKVAGGRGQVVDQKVEKYDRTEIPNLGTVESGDLVEIELDDRIEERLRVRRVRGHEGGRLRAGRRSAAATTATSWAPTWSSATTA